MVNTHIWYDIPNSYDNVQEVHLSPNDYLQSYVHVCDVAFYQIWQIEFERNDHTTGKMYLCRIP